MSSTLLLSLLLAGGVGLIFLLGWFLIGMRWQRKRDTVERRALATGSEPQIILREPPRGWAQRLDYRFEQMVSRTGLDLDPSMALAVIFFCGVLLATVVYLWRYNIETWPVLPAFLIGAGVPLAFLLWRQRTWRQTLKQQLPDAFFLLARSIRAGRSVDQAFQLLGDQGAPPLSREFARMHRQLELGLSMSQVLQSTADRLGLIDFNIFASVMSLHRATGGNLPAMLDRLAASTRDRNQFEGQYRAATVLGRYSAAFILAMTVVIAVYWCFFQRDEWGMRFFDTTYDYVGITMFAVAIGLEILGGFLLYLMLRYEY